MVGRDIQILLADDNAEQLDLLVAALDESEPRINVTTAASAQDLLALLVRQTFDCVVIDCNISSMAPLQVIKAASERAEGCPIIAISNHQEQSVVIESLHGGAVDFVPKPQAMQPRVLWNAIETAVDGVRREEIRQREDESCRAELETLAHTDPLTGLFNRRSLDRRASDGRRDADRMISACILLDIDHFKRINDRFGHAAGDAVLVEVGRLIQSSIRSREAGFRWGGEEFLILRSCAGLGEAYVWADGLRRKLAELPILVEGGSVKIQVTASIGVELVSGGLHQEVIDRADQAMYCAKKLGRNRVCTGSMVVVREALRSASDMKNATMHEKRRRFLGECEKSLSDFQRTQVTGHGERVALLAGELGRAMGMSSSESRRLQDAGLLHDLGTCLVPADLLEKTQVLTNEEWNVIHHLPSEGAKMSLLLGADRGAAEAIRRRGEWFCRPSVRTRKDRGTGILRSILQVADAFIAMTAGRPYRRPLPPQAARRELDAERGRQFDPAVIDLLTADRMACCQNAA